MTYLAQKLCYSKAAEAKKYTFLKSLKALLTDKNCILLIIGAALAIATNLTIAGTLQFILAPYGFTPVHINSLL